MYVLPSISSKTGTECQLEAVEASEDVKPDLPEKEVDETEPKKAKLSVESPTDIPVTPSEGTDPQGDEHLLSTSTVCLLLNCAGEQQNNSKH